MVSKLFVLKEVVDQQLVHLRNAAEIDKKTDCNLKQLLTVSVYHQ